MRPSRANRLGLGSMLVRKREPCVGFVRQLERAKTCIGFEIKQYKLYYIREDEQIQKKQGITKRPIENKETKIKN